MPAGTCIPIQLHGVHVRAANRAHCCSGVNGPGPAQGGVSGVPQTGSADAAGIPAKLLAAMIQNESCKRREASDAIHWRTRIKLGSDR